MTQGRLISLHLWYSSAEWKHAHPTFERVCLRTCGVIVERHLVLRTTIPCHITSLVACVASHLTLPFELLLALKSATFGDIKFHWYGSVRILVLVAAVRLLAFEVK
jgi:hypothetical protein